MTRKILFLTFLCFCAMGAAKAPTVDNVLDAICTVETGGRDIDGDGGKSIGLYQIGRACWKDAGVPGKYSDCHNAAYARRVALAYMMRYEPQAVANGDAQTLSRLWNGGPGWRKHPHATNGYWRKVQATLGQ